MYIVIIKVHNSECSVPKINFDFASISKNQRLNFQVFTVTGSSMSMIPLTGAVNLMVLEIFLDFFYYELMGAKHPRVMVDRVYIGGIKHCYILNVQM